MKKEIKLRNIFKLNEDQYYCEFEDESGKFILTICHRDDSPTKYLVEEIENKNLEFGNYEDYITYRQSIPEEQKFTLQKEIGKLDEWFEEYDNQAKQYERALRLNEPFDKDMEQLDLEAKINSKKIKELRIKLKELEDKEII